MNNLLTPIPDYTKFIFIQPYSYVRGGNMKNKKISPSEKPTSAFVLSLIIVKGNLEF